MDENKNTENIENQSADEAIAEALPEAVEENIDEAVAETQAAEVTKKKSKIFIAYICGFVLFMAVAVTALVGFGLYANNLVHGGDEANLAGYSVELTDGDIA